MSFQAQQWRIEGIYPQRQQGFFMQRVKLPAGLISSAQARCVAAIAERYARGLVHLTVRSSMELHWLTEENLPSVAKEMSSTGLISRGACGGAVRGVVCGSLGSGQTPRLEALVRIIHRHFSGNPRFESLPKKFKVGIESDRSSGRHLIQDIGLIPAAAGEDGGNRYDVYAAGGLGRLPTPGFLLAEAVPEERLIPLIETVLTVYVSQTPAGKRLKHLVAQIGQDAFREQVLTAQSYAETVPLRPSHFQTLVAEPPSPAHRVAAVVFAGELQAADLEKLASFADDFADGMLLVTGDQNVAIHVNKDPQKAREALQQAGFTVVEPGKTVSLQVCPGNHECIFGLCATREVAAQLLEDLAGEGERLTWAISGCPNSCAQPQLSQYGVISSKLVEGEGGKEPRFDLYQMKDGPFAEKIQQGLTLDELRAAVRR